MSRRVRSRLSGWSWAPVAAGVLLTATGAWVTAAEFAPYVRFLGDDRATTITVTDSSRVSRRSPGWVRGHLPDGRAVEARGRPWTRPSPGDVLPVRIRDGDPPDVRYDVHPQAEVWLVAAATPIFAVGTGMVARGALADRRAGRDRARRERERLDRRRERLARRRARREIPPSERHFGRDG